jgi:lipid-A-disaccharide synthase
MKCVVSAGELSGDEHAARLVASLKMLVPDIELRGMGMRNLIAAGLHADVDAARGGSIMGFTEVLGGLGRARRTWRTMTALLTDWRPDVLVVVNYSEFNLRLARFASQLHIPTVFFIPPQVWAWRPGRVKTINECVDAVICIFPFEPAFYRGRGCDKAVFVGHPFVDLFREEYKVPADRTALIGAAGLDPERPVLVIFPGSRRKEIRNHLEFVRETFSRAAAETPGLQGLVVSASAEWVPEFAARLADVPAMRVVHGDSLRYMQVADFGLIKSGTSNLQAAFVGLPFVMFYNGSYLTKFLVNCLAPHITQYSIVNIIKKNTVPEMAVPGLTAGKVLPLLMPVIRDEAVRADLRDRFSQVVKMLSTPDNNSLFEGCATASERAARIVLDVAQRVKTKG